MTTKMDTYCSVESAERLKELGVAQESKEYFRTNAFMELLGSPPEKCSAFTEDELDDLLPRGCETWKGTYEGKPVWIVWNPIDWSTTQDERRVEAKAKMLRRILGDKTV